MPSIRFIRLLFAVVPLFIASVTSAQIPDPATVAQLPKPGVGHDYIGIGAETVNPADGSLSFDLPIQPPPGRKLSFPFGIHYNSSERFSPSGTGPTVLWVLFPAPPFQLNGWNYQLPVYTAEVYKAPYGLNPQQQEVYCDYTENYVFRGSDGIQRNFSMHGQWPDDGNTQYGWECSVIGVGGPSYDFVASSGTPSWPVHPALTVTDPSGTNYQFPGFQLAPSDTPTPWGLMAQTITDRNGNQITFTGSSNSGTSGSYKDTLGRTVVSWSGIGSSSGDQVTVAGLSGNVLVHWTTVTESFPESGHDVGDNGVAGPCTMTANQTSPQQISAVSEIDIPGNPTQKYFFSYDSTYARPNKITFPGGGYVRYVWGLNTSSEVSYEQWPVSGTANATCWLLHDTAAITDRYVSYDGVTEVLHQHFSYAPTTWGLGGNSAAWSQKSTTVTSTDLAATHQVTVTTYNYVPGSVIGSSQVPVEQQIVYQDGSSHTLKTVNKTWLSGFHMIGEQAILDNGQGNATLRCYSNWEVSDIYEYGFQAEGAKPPDPSCGNNGTTLSAGLNTSAIGPLRRHTAVVYHNFGTHILNEPDSVTVYDGSGTQMKQTTYGYDGSSLVASGAVNVVPVSTPRGNATSVTRWLNTGGTSPATTFTYYDTGQVATMTDPCGSTSCADMTGSNHTTQYFYADSYASCGGAAPPSGQTNAYPTQIIDALGHAQNLCYGYTDGQLRSSTDQNSQTTNYQYADPLLRLTEVDYPPDPNNGNQRGKTTHSYNDSPPSPSVTTSRLMNTSNQYVTSTTTMDGLGHTVRSVLTSDPDCASGDRTDTTYDGLGHVYTVSNPYCTTGDSTYGLTTYFYDALGRSCLVVPPDGTLPSGGACPGSQPANTVFTAYSGNTTTVTDQAGKKRQSATDGLGRLTQVTEDPGGLGYVTAYGYDVLDNLLSVVQNGSRQRTFVYDSLSRLTSATNPESGTTTYSYDANGNLTGKTDARNVSVGYCYDALNRLACKTYSPTFAIGYYYDQTTWGNWTLTNPIGRLTSEGTYDGICWPTYSIFGYDTMGRVSFQEDYLNTAETSGCPGAWSTISASYDLAGNQTSLTYPSGRAIKSQFNGASRPTKIFVDDFNGYNYLSSANYAPFGSPTTFALGNGATETSTYNKRLQPLNQQLANTTSTLLNRTYGFYDTSAHNNGNVISITDNLNSGLSQNFSYDSLNRLYTAQTTGTSGPDCWGQQFGYDPWGNLRTETPNVPGCPTNMLNLGVNANNQITNTGFAYDAAGNMTNDGTNSYAYDAENHLTSLNSGAATYTYDSQGRRMAKKIGSATTEYIYFNGDVLAEYNPGDLLWNDYIFAGGRRLAAAGTDDILNPGFEQGMEAWQWGTSDPSGTAQVITDPTRAHSGNNYLQLSSTTAVSVSAGQLVSVNPGDQLTFGGWAYIEPGSATGGVIAWDIAVLDANGNVLAYYGSAVTSTGVWTHLSTNYTVPSGAASVSLYCQIYQPTGLTTARFDDAFLTGASGLGVRYYHADHLGSARLMTDSSGNQTWSATYLPFGQEWNPQVTTNHYKFTGKERDAESGLDNFGARYNSSSMGRFMSPDPIVITRRRVTDPQRFNLYAYARNNPLRYTDPTGMDLWEKGCGKESDECHKDYVGTWDKDHKNNDPN